MRRGAILIIVAGLAVLLAGLALTFLIRLRADAEESAATVREVQSRIMLVVACTYIQEAARLGWDLSPTSHPTWAGRYPTLATTVPGSDFTDPVRWRLWRNLRNADGSPLSGADPATMVHEEAFGWIDVRLHRSTGAPLPAGYLAPAAAARPANDGLQTTYIVLGIVSAVLGILVTIRGLQR